MRAKAHLRLCVSIVWLLISVALMAGCILAVEQAVPTIALDPVVGGPGTPVVVTGSGFPPEARVSIRLGPPSVGATPHSYGDTTTDASGAFTLSFTVPARWPDGTPIPAGELIVVGLNEDGSTKATAPFDYTPGSEAPAQEPDDAEAGRQVILQWRRKGGQSSFCGNVVVYESGYAEIASCTQGAAAEPRLLSEEATERLYTWREVYQSFEIERSTGTGAERVTTHLVFSGNGSRAATETELRLIQTLLETLISSP